MADSPSLPKPPAPTASNWFGEVVRAWGPAILAVLLIRTFVFEPFRIPSGSMVPTLLIGDHVFVSKFAYGLYVPYTGVEVPFLDYAVVVDRFELLDLGDPQRGDIVVFRYPKNQQQNYIKRVMATGGDTISVRNGKVIVNGEEQPQEFQGKFEFVDADCRSYPSKGYIETAGGVPHDVLAAPHSNMFRTRQEVKVPEGHVFVMGDNRDNSLDSRAWGFVKESEIKGKAHFVWFSWNSCANGVRLERVFRPLYGTSMLTEGGQ